MTANGKLGLTADDTYYTKDDFQRSLVESFVMNSIPFNVMDNYFYRKPYLMLSQTADLVSANTIQRHLLQLYSSMKSAKKEEFANLDSKVSFTTDCWTSPNNNSFMGLTAQGIEYLRSDIRYGITTCETYRGKSL